MISSGAKNIVAVTSSEYGFFLVQPDEAKIEAELQNIRADVQQRSRYVKTADDVSSCPSLKQTRKCHNYQDC